MITFFFFSQYNTGFVKTANTLNLPKKAIYLHEVHN